VVPQAVLPPVEPVTFVDLPPEDARAFNAGVPYSTAPNPAARPFRFAGGPEDLTRAADCLATAVLYEAGDDPAGQRAVAQVVINRARHPAFPKTICGVVFEGQERRTGCQFSFTCDGALNRWKPAEAMWTRAQEVAVAALSGTVYRKVGHATHYHTDWVVPYWQSSLDKISKVGDHLFFRWTGWWGTPPAFNRQVAQQEPVIGAIASLSPAHRTAGALAEADAALAETVPLVVGAPPKPLATDPDSFLIALPLGLAPEAWPPLALHACGDRPVCRFSAWSDPARTPAALPLGPEQVATMTFSYLRDRGKQLERTLWNCRQVKRANPRECMRQQVLLTGIPASPVLPVPSSATTTTAQARDAGMASATRAMRSPLAGVRRAGEPDAVATPRPTPRPSPTPRRTPVPLRPPGTSPAATP
jgi:spore germination cell wall hydrolase CwlJ-like protein